MLSLGVLSFAMPWALLALGLLPVLWWLLRITPPTPLRVRFPPVRLLLGLVARQESAAKTPWWLLLLRLALAAAVILAAAQPLINAGQLLRGDGPLVLVIDDGWAAARDWPARRATLDALLDEAERQERAVVVATTAPVADGAPAALSIESAAAARRALRSLQPKPWAPKRAAAFDALLGPRGLATSQPGHVAWLSDGIGDAATAAAAERLRRLGNVTVFVDAAAAAVVLRLPDTEGEALLLEAVRPSGPAATAWVRAIGDDGAVLAREPLRFGAGEARASVRLVLPAELRNRLVRLEIEGAGTAGGVVLVDERWRRRPVGIYAGAGALSDQPLLSEAYYLKRALAPYTEIREGAIEDLLRRELSIMLLADAGRLDEAEQARLSSWIERGGVVVRFAGPRLAHNVDELLPVRLRAGDRAMGGAMSWNKPATLAPFGPASPFHGLAVPRGVTVQSQVLAQPSLDLPSKTWAELSDGTPLVTAERRGQGWLVLVHTTANTAWSNLALSGLYVEMLRRFVDLGRGVAAGTEAGPLGPLETLDGFGHLGPPPADALAIAGTDFAGALAGPRHPPGYYGSDAARRALNLSASLPDPQPLPAFSGGVARAAYGGQREIDLMPWLLSLAFLLAIADLMASLALRRLLPRAAPIAVALLLLSAAGDARAQTDERAAMMASLETHLAYVVTGDAEVDEVSRAGLTGLSVIVNRRTAAELADAVGVDPASDELAFYPLLYWAIGDAARPPSAAAVDRLNAYLRNGGTIFFDTRGSDTAAAFLRRLGQDLNIPPLTPMPADHVLSRSYYLMREFPGRWDGKPIWVERPGERVNDGVSSVIVGAHDWAAAWALDDLQRPLYAAVPGGERQREWAYRFGINLLMYTLTGNYKADQVHLPAILQRLGE